MTEIRVLDDEAQFRAHTNVFRRAMYMTAPSDDDWKVVLPSYESDRSLAAFDGDEMIGTTQSYGSSLVVPGGAVVPHAAVSYVGACVRLHAPWRADRPDAQATRDAA